MGGLNGSLSSAVSGLGALSTELNIIGDNISNQGTVGFKAGEASFSSLVTGDSGTNGGSGVRGFNRAQIDQQGLVQNTGIATDISISGNGFFVVTDSPQNGEFFYSRAGSFRQDALGNFVNSSGFFLQAHPLDSEGRLPGEIGNENTTSADLLESLTVVNTRDISGVAFATSQISLGLNLDANQASLLGAGDEGSPVAASINNGAASTNVLAPTSRSVTIDSDGDLTDEIYDNGLEVGDFLDIQVGADTAVGFQYGGLTQSVAIGAGTPIYGATDVNQSFDVTQFDSATTGNAIFTASVGAETFTFQFGTPGTVSTDGTRFFNSLTSLASALNAVTTINANVVNGSLLVSAVDARQAIDFADVEGTLVSDAAGAINGGLSGSGGVAPGVFGDIAAAAAGVRRFSSIEGLATLVNEESNLQAVVTSPTNNAQIRINTTDPLSTISFTSRATNGANILNELGFQTGGNILPQPVIGDNVEDGAGDPGLQTIAVTFDATYAAIPPLGSTSSNLASGDIAPAFSRNIRVFDSLGVGHDLLVSFAKASDNNWLVEVYAANPEELITTNPNGILAFGEIEFNGDGSLRNVSPGLAQPISAVWSNQSNPQLIELDLGTAGEPAGTLGATQIGLTDGLSQFAGDFTVQFSEQNGSSAGLLSSVEIDGDGFVIANFSNGESRRVFQVPIATFPNANGLAASSGNIFSQSAASGEFTLNQSGDSGAGIIEPRSLEGANVELAEQLTDLIIAQRAFQANTQVITTADELLQELNNI